MAPKKKKTKKGISGSAASSTEGRTIDNSKPTFSPPFVRHGDDHARPPCTIVQNYAPTILPISDVSGTSNWVRIEMKLLGWSYMDFDVTLPTDTYLFKLKNQLRHQHGRTSDLILCRHEFRERNEMVDDMKTLEEYGIMGGSGDKEDAPTVTIYYDFKPCERSDPDPVLLTWRAS